MSRAKQTKLVGELDEIHLEKNSSPSALTVDRITESALLVARAAILPEKADLHSALQRSDTLLAIAQRLTGTACFGWSVASGEVYWSEQTYNIFEQDRAPKLTLEMVLRRIHPDDRGRVQQALTRASEAKADFHLEYRWLMPDGSIKHRYLAARALTTSSGNLEFLGAAIDVTAAKEAEENRRQDEDELRRITDVIPQLLVVLNPDGRTIYVNRMTLEYTGLSIEEIQADSSRDRIFHPEDNEQLREVRRSALLKGVPFEAERQVLGKDGKYRWYLLRYNPFRDEQGRLVRWYATGTDIEDRKVAEQRLQNENVALREEVDRVSMFEEIVGTSTALSTVLARVAKVAQTDSTVLITGETGTGKELVARAIHKRSRRAQRAFVSVNCAALAPSLISSELFGHEKGAFNASWELDFFGRVRHNIEAQRQRTLADASDLAAMQVTVVGDVASTYIDLRGRQELLRIARENVENQQDTVRLVEAAYSAGRGTQFDTARSRALLETTTSRIPELLSAIAVDEHRLAVLCGLPPDALVSELDVVKALPDLPERIDPGTPANLIRRRPDVSASEQRLHAATEQIAIATADLFPRVNFAGLLGLNEFHGDTPFDGISAVNLAELNIDWSFLDRGRVRARIAASQPDGDAQLAQYQQSVLLALEDVENALVSYARSEDRDVQLQLAAKDSKRAADLATIRFRNGATGLLDLLEAQRAQLKDEDAYAESHSNSALSAVLLYKSLSGGWPQRPPQPPKGGPP